MKKINFLLIIIALSTFFACNNAEKETKTEATEQPKAQEVNVYSHRHYESDKMLFAQFEKETGIKVNVIKASADELIERIASEGDKSPADLLITVDAGRLYRAKEKGLLQAISSSTIEAIVPKNLRDSSMNWVALTKRARVIAYAKGRVKPESITTYDDLAAKAWKGKVVVRSSSNIYNQSIMASFIHNIGEAKATTWAKGVVANMKQAPAGGDTDQIKNLAANNGDLTLINSYYYGKMLGDSLPENRAIAEKIGIIFPNQKTTGTHINVSGAGLCKNAPNKDNAVKLLEFLLSTNSQEVFAKTEFEYPINKDAKISEILTSWGTFKEDTLNLDILGKLNSNAVKVFDAASWK